MFQNETDDQSGPEQFYSTFYAMYNYYQKQPFANVF